MTYTRPYNNCNSPIVSCKSKIAISSHLPVSIGVPSVAMGGENVNAKVKIFVDFQMYDFSSN